MKTNIKTHRHLVAAAHLLLALILLLPAMTRGAPAVQAWIQRYDGPMASDDYAYAVTVDGSNNVIVTGWSYNYYGTYYDYATIKYSSAGAPLWTNRYNGNGPGNGNDQAVAVAVDGSNNVIVTGYSTGNGGGDDYATVQYSSAGVPLWTNRYNGPANGGDDAWAVAVDGSNNVIVTGWSYATNSNSDYATIQYSSAGVPRWTNRYNGPGNSQDQAFAVAVDASNNVIVTGYSIGSGSGYDYATIQYSSAGVPLWTNRYNGPGNGADYARAVAVDGSNNIIVTGRSIGSGSGYDYATIQYSSAGVPLWTNRYNGPGNSDDYAMAVAVDVSNNVIVTGYSTNSGSGYDYATIQYSSAGVPLWTNRYNGPGNGYDDAWAMAVDGSNNVIVTGWSYATNSNLDYATIKYSSAGVPLWTNRYSWPGSGYDEARAVAVDRSGNVIVTGSSYNGTNNDFATIKYVSPPVMTGLTQPDGTFQLRLDDPAQAPTVVVEASTDLSGWSPVFTNTTPTNVLFYTDPDASNYLWRFYRASEQWSAGGSP
jgi:uncharacterized delta-60 repeat protein